MSKPSIVAVRERESKIKDTPSTGWEHAIDCWVPGKSSLTPSGMLPTTSNTGYARDVPLFVNTATFDVPPLVFNP